MGRFQGTDGQWLESDDPPAEGWWVDANDVWQPPLHTAPPLPTAPPAGQPPGVANPPPPVGPVGPPEAKRRSNVGVWIGLVACGSLLVIVVAIGALFRSLWDSAGDQIDGDTCDAFWALIAQVDAGIDPRLAIVEFQAATLGHNLDSEVGQAAEQLAQGDADDPRTAQAIETLSEACS